MEHETDERRAMILAARLATRRRQPARVGAGPPANGKPAAAAIWQQTARAMTGWMGLAPFLFVSPFLWNPPLWISLLSMMSERDGPNGSRR